MSDPIVGIDLGTSNSVVGYCDATGAVRVLADDSGYKIHPSVVSFHPSGGVVVGSAAKQRKVIDPANTIYSVKRLVGRTYNSPEVQTAKERSPFQIKEGANQMPMIVTRGGEFAVPEISALVLDHVRNIAATTLDTEVSRAVVTVPASFNDAQRTATATAGAIAGITVVRVLNEPTAAALAYGHARNLKQVIAVYDFGGGTFDITLLRLQDEVYEVLGTAGDSFLGGDDLDERIVDKMVNRFLADNRIDLRNNEVSMMRLRAVAEQTKIELSRRSRAVVRVDEIAYGAKGVALNLQIEVTRDEFVQQCADIIDRTFPVCNEAMKLAGLDPSQIDDIILVGGTTKIPYVRDQVSKFFGKAPRTDVNPEEAVAVGAALQASALDRALRPSNTAVTKMPTLEKTEGDYEFGVEDESLTFPQGAKGEPTDPRAKLPSEAATKVGGAGGRKSAPITSEDEVEDTNIRPPPTADEKRPSGAYSAKGSVEKFEEKPGSAIGRMGKSGQIPAQTPLEKMGKVPARTFGKPLEKVTSLPPNPRGKGAAQTPPAGTAAAPPARPTPTPKKETANKFKFTMPDFAKSKDEPDTTDKAAAMEDTAVALPSPPSPVAAPHAATMIHTAEDPLAQSGTTPGVGGSKRSPTVVPAPGLADLMPPNTAPNPYAAPPNRPPQSYPVMKEPPPTQPPPKAGPAMPTMKLEPQNLRSTLQGPPPSPASRPSPNQPKAWEISDEDLADMTGPDLAEGNPLQAFNDPFADLPIGMPVNQGFDPLGDLPVGQPVSSFNQQTYVPPPEPRAPAPNPFAAPPQAQPFPPPPPEQPFPQHQRPAPRSQPPPIAAAESNPFVAESAPALPRPIPAQMPTQAMPPMPQAPSPVVLDVTPRGLGIGTVAGYCEELIRRNSRLPAEAKKLFSTSRDNQELVRIVVCQGESRRLDNNVVLGDLVMEGLPPRSRGETEIEVTFTLDVSGILKVRARDAKTGAEQRASVDLLGAMPEKDVSEARERLQQLRR